jgi:flagellar hook-associated protein FlgK
MSTEEERIAKKEKEIEKLRGQIDRATQQIYYKLIGSVETDEQKALFKRYRDLDKKIDRVERKYDQTLNDLREEREQIFNELSNSLK